MARARAKAKAKHSPRIYGAVRSKPGEPPHKQTGRLRASIAHEILDETAGPTARIGTNLPYGRYLEIGTRRMAARPYLKRALDDSIPEIRALFRD